jgi:hypothetical protein
MKAIDENVEVPADFKKELAEALDNLSKGIRDPEAAKKASERMDRMREENRKLLGEQACAVEIVRRMRNDQ